VCGRVHDNSTGAPSVHSADLLEDAIEFAPLPGLKPTCVQSNSTQIGCPFSCGLNSHRCLASYAVATLKAFKYKLHPFILNRIEEATAAAGWDRAEDGWPFEADGGVDCASKYVQDTLVKMNVNGFPGFLEDLDVYGARFRQKSTLDDAIGSHACSLEALACV
jgi:hypothetical protein